jgi:hypothetical protein
MVSLQNPGADISGLRPPWIPPEKHYVGYFCDVDALKETLNKASFPIPVS